MFGLYILAALYLLAAFAGFIAPYHYDNQVRELLWAPRTPIHFSDANGFSWRPFVHPVKQTFDDNLNAVFTTDTSQRAYLRFFVQGDTYNLLGLIPSSLHLFGVDDIKPAPGSSDPYFTRLYLMGADISGRDIFSRICHGAWISMTIGILGSAITFTIGMLIGGISGYFGGRVDMALQRFCEMMMLLPGFYLLLMLRFMFPAEMSSVEVYFAVILIMSLIGWAGTARVIRGMVLSIRNQPFVEAGRAMGASHLRIIVRHVLPNTLSYAIVSVSLAIPGYILGESSLSLLGLGIVEPMPSWGNMLTKAMDITELKTHPWVLWPGLFIFLAVMAFNLVGDGLRDAFDPRQVRR
jgi:peptide/nickel transport system permease protein